MLLSSMRTKLKLKQGLRNNVLRFYEAKTKGLSGMGESKKSEKRSKFPQILFRSHTFSLRT